MDVANPEILKTIRNIEQDKPVDLVFILRGGATDVYTLISNLRALQQRLPHNHISETHPYVLADSAGAYPAAGLIGPNPVDPRDLPNIFQRNISRYLSPDRTEAEQALVEDVGDILIKDSVIPVTISSIEITSSLVPAYFTHFPEAYSKARSGFIAPQNQNEHVKATQAAMASSAFLFKLGDYHIGDRRFMDMAFLETHPTNLLDYYLGHKNSSPERRLVCVVFGNNYSDFEIDLQERIKRRYLKHHFASAIRTRAQSDLVNFATRLFGSENVIDLSLYIKQPLNMRNLGPTSDAFRRDELAIRERISWTEAQLRSNAGLTAQLDRLADMIRRGSLPQASIAPATSPIEENSAYNLVIPPQGLTSREKLMTHARNIAPTLVLASEVVAETVEPFFKKARPVVAAGATVLATGMAHAGTWLGQQWAENARPWIGKQLASADRKLLPNLQRPSAAVTQPSQTHSSEPHTPSEFGHKPL